MNLVKVENTQNYQVEDSEGLSPYLHLIERRDSDYFNLDSMYNHLEALNLRECETCNIMINKRVLINGEFHSREDALMNLDCTYWVKLLEDSKIRDLMPYTEFCDLIDNFKTRNKEKYIPFNYETVSSFISRLIDSKPVLFANKVNTLLGELDYTYKNNRGSMIPAMMILKTSYSIFPSWQNCQLIDDLRFSLRQIYGLDLSFEKTQEFFSYHDAGDWHSVDDDLIRIKRFKNANVHILLSDKVYDKLNEIIAIVNKNILPEDCKRIRKKTYKYEGELNG